MIHDTGLLGLRQVLLHRLDGLVVGVRGLGDADRVVVDAGEARALQTAVGRREVGRRDRIRRDRAQQAIAPEERSDLGAHRIHTPDISALITRSGSLTNADHPRCKDSAHSQTPIPHIVSISAYAPRLPDTRYTVPA